MGTLRIPSATYRLQFNAHFRFENARALVEYFNRLGITDIYSSPLLQARRGSLHGYDVTNPSQLNEEMGSEQELESLTSTLHQHQMGLLLDIVPNHMAAGSENPWWMDVLEDGPGSAYASFFDIDWHPPRVGLQNKVLLPILANPYAQELENQKIKLIFEQTGFFIQYYDGKLPVAPKTYLLILHHRLDELQHQLGVEHPAFRELGGICAAAHNLPDRVALSTELAGARRMQREALKERLGKLYRESPEVRAFVDENIRIFNGHRRQATSFVWLDRLLSAQAYVLSYWLSRNDEINYRRFFTINNLVGLQIEDPLVFEATHAVILRLIAHGSVTGLRIDHVDGLRDPHAYLRRLQERCGTNSETNGHPPFYVVVEKILAKGEKLPGEWPICGATGYASLNALNGLFLDSQGCNRVRKTYEKFLGASIRYENLVYAKKKEVMETLLAVEMRALGHHLALLAEQDRYARDVVRHDLTAALAETTACLPIYRTYTRNFASSSDERRYLERALHTARSKNPQVSPQAFNFVSDVLLLREKGYIPSEQREARLAFVMRWQQFTGPIMAKGLEDSALYVYNPLISLNEVGGDPESVGVPVAKFHDFCRNRQRHGHTLNATTTHDTKRAEDVRARINVLSELPGLWERNLRQWARWNKPWKKSVSGQSVPDPNEEIFLYQSMLGAWPLDERDVPRFSKRLRDYMVKAAREARVHTKWSQPNFRYEQALLHFIRSINKPSGDNAFLPSFLRFQRVIAYYGAINALSQLLLKITIPGVPDIYQGSELWDFRLVDPDNRGPVNFAERTRLLRELQEQERAGDRLALVQDLLDHWPDSRVKLFLTSIALNFRKSHEALFREGAYQSLTVTGSKRDCVFAFLRSGSGTHAIVATPRLVTRLSPAGSHPIGQGVWGTGAILLPPEAPVDWTNVLTGEPLQATGSMRSRFLPLAGVFGKFPGALLSSGS